ncbi:MAG: hypothetical protein QNJ90_04120 [Planctomycetota bacterium]|nr:hypothetical protein [Planctomycetota bacterium]
MKSTILILTVAVVSIAFLGVSSPTTAVAETPAETPAEAPERIHQPSAIEEGIGVAPAIEFTQPASTFDARFGSAC